MIAWSYFVPKEESFYAGQSRFLNGKSWSAYKLIESCPMTFRAGMDLEF